VAAPARAEPARPRRRRGRLGPAPELPRDGPGPAVAGDAAAPGRAPRRPAARPQRPAAGGRARPAYPEHRLGDPPLAAVADAVARLLAAYEPFPALVVDRHWELVDANEAVALLTAGCAPALLEPPCNVLRLCLHPDGLAPRITTLGSWRAHLLGRLRHQVAATGDPALAALLDELRAYPAPPADPGPAHAAPVVPVRLRGPDGRELAFLSTTTLFGTPGDVTVAELAIEAFLPADDATAELLGAARPALRPAPATA
jgi:MmyB-like transcription regulator ligand binding domain